MTELEVRQKYINILYNWYKQGLKESNGSHMTIINIYNAHKPLAQGYKVKSTDSWCATTVSAAAVKAEQETSLKYTSIIPTECSCPRQVALFKKLGEWQENDAYVPTIGDVIYYDWQDNGIGNNTGTPDHVGVVYSVSAGWITVIEGNKADAIGLRRIAVNGKYIRGFGVPKYSKLASNKTNTVAPAKTSITPKTTIYKAGTKYYLNRAALYVSSSSSKVAAYHTGNVYICDSQVINGRIRVVDDASEIGNINKVIGWVAISSISTAQNTTKSVFASGSAVKLTNTALYAASTSSKASSHLTGTYYIWSSTIVNNRVRITRAKSYAGKSGKVVGWISFAAIKSQFRGNLL